MDKDKEFLLQKLNDTLATYRKKFQSERTPKNILKELNWEIIEVMELIDKVTNLQEVYKDLQSVSADDHKKMKEDLLTYLKDLYIKKRTPSTHVMVFMLSEERRCRKPYSLPVLYVPYRGMSHDNLRRIRSMIEEEMKKLDMHYAGKSVVHTVHVKKHPVTAYALQPKPLASAICNYIKM